MPRTSHHRRPMGGRGSRRGGGGRPSEALDLFSGGTFTRGSEGSYLTGPATSGSTAFLAWASSHQRRFEYDPNLPGGLGLLMEGSRTNICPLSRDGATWTGGTAPTGSLAGPDGAAEAERWVVASAALGHYRSIGTIAAGRWTQSVYARSGTPARGAFQRTTIAGTGGTWDTTVGASYQRIEAQDTASGADAYYYVPADGRVWSGDPATAVDVIMDLHQIEVGHWPSSPIRVPGLASVARAADVLSYAVGEYPASFLTMGFRVRVALASTSAEVIAASADMRIVQVGASDYLRVRASDGACVVDLVCGGVVVATKTITLASRGVVLTLTAEPSAGSLTVEGATTGDGAASGTGAAWASGTLYVGASNTGASNAFGRFVRYIEAL